MGRERAFLDNPFIKGFNLDVETCIRVLAWDNTVNGRVGKTRTVMYRGESIFRGVLWVFDEVGKGGCGANSVFTGNDGKRCRGSTAVDSFGDNGGDEFENVGSNRTGDLEVSCEQW